MVLNQNPKTLKVIMFTSQVKDLVFESRRVRVVNPCQPLNPRNINLSMLSRIGKDHNFLIDLNLFIYKWELALGLDKTELFGIRI